MAISENLTLEEQHALDDAPNWYPYHKDGRGQPDTITGELLSLEEFWCDEKDEHRIRAILRPGPGKFWAIRTYPNALHARWLRVAPQIGQHVSVKWTGMAEAKRFGGKEYPTFSVAVEQPQAEAFSYSKFNGGNEPERPGEPEPSRQLEMTPEQADAVLGPPSPSSPPEPEPKEDDDVPF